MDDFWGVSNKQYARILKRLQGQPFTKDANHTLNMYKDMLKDAISNFNNEYTITKDELNTARKSLQMGFRPGKSAKQMLYESKISSLNDRIKNTQNLVNELKQTDNVNLNQVAGVVSKYNEEIAGMQRARLQNILRQLGKANKYLNAAPLGELGVGIKYLPALDLILTRDEGQYNKKLEKMFRDRGINYSNGQFQL